MSYKGDKIWLFLRNDPINHKKLKLFSMAFESRIKVRTRVQLVDVNITTDCVCRDPCK